MNRQDLICALQKHGDAFEDEQDMIGVITRLLDRSKEDAFHNYHWDDGHITASMLVVNPEYTKVLLMFHKKLERWLQFGGHSDDSPDVLATAIREFHEESGITEDPIVFSYGYADIPIFDVDIHEIPPDPKGRPFHRHYDIRFLGIIDDTVSINMQQDEVDDIKWFDIASIESFITEPGTLRMIKKIRNLPY